MRAIDIISIIIILSLSIWSWGGNAQPPPAVSGFHLNLQWPTAFCELNSGKCKSTPLPDSFTIHGLWPHNRAWKPLINCQGNPFDATSIKGPLRADLNAFWPTVSRDFTQNQDFWRYEWNTHGKCSESKEFTQTVYFQNAIALRKKADVLGALNQKRIFTSEDGKSRTGKDIKAAIKEQLGALPELSCPSKVFLSINLCVNRLATMFVDCPASENCENDYLKFIPSVAGFRLNLQWPAAFCELNPGRQCKTPLPKTFTIHGLWPHNRAGRLLQNCEGSSFDPNSIKGALLADMNALWPTTFSDTSNQYLWKDKWDKHGKCSEKVDFTQNKYFTNAIALRKKGDVLRALIKKGIKPDGEKNYRGEKIIKVIKENLNGKPELVCQNKDDVIVLTELNLCVNQDRTMFVDCPTPTPAPAAPSVNCDNAYKIKFTPLPNPAPPPLVSLYTPI